MFSKRAITLLEVLLTLVVISISFLLAFTVLETNGGMELRRWSRHLISDLRWAQSQAITKQQRHFIRLHPDGNNYLVFVMVENEETVLLQRNIEPPVKLVGASIDPPQFAFTPTGAPSRACTITLAQRGSKALITIRVGTGRVRVVYE